MARVIHFEVLSDNPEALARFYQEALGWKPSKRDMPGPAYWLVATGPESEEGINGAIMGRMFGQSVINTIEVPSFEKVQAKIVAAGGKLLNGPHEIPNVGLHAYFVDTSGNMFGVLQPPKGRPRPPATAAKPAAKPAAKAPAKKAAAKPAVKKAPAKKPTPKKPAAKAKPKKR